jgi:hypothetical protein
MCVATVLDERPIAGLSAPPKAHRQDIWGVSVGAPFTVSSTKRRSGSLDVGSAASGSGAGPVCSARLY